MTKKLKYAPRKDGYWLNGKFCNNDELPVNSTDNGIAEGKVENLPAEEDLAILLGKCSKE